MNTWNPVFNLVMKIKYDYKKKFGLDVYNLETWIEKLNKKEYIDFIAPLKIVSKNHLCLIRYGIDHWNCGMWEDQNSIYRECRSITIDLKYDEMILTPWSKFFNLNEVAENQIDKIIDEIERSKSFEITNKLDGSMQCARYYKNKIIMSGSQSLDPNNSWRLKEGYSMLTDNHIRMIKDYSDYTHIFEYISLKDCHVVKYTEEQQGLYLIGMRNVKTGHIFSYKEIKKIADSYNVKMTEIEQLTLENILQKTKEYTCDQKEGWVLNIDGHMIKLKCDDYSKLHVILDRIGSVNAIIKAIADNTLDDLLAKVPTVIQSDILSRAQYVFDYIDTIHKYSSYYYRLAPKEDKKEFMKWVQINIPKILQTYCISRYLDREINYIKSCLNSETPKYMIINEMESNLRKIRNLNLDI